MRRQTTILRKSVIVARRNAKAAQASAEAAKASADAVINSERAWLLVEKLDGEYLVPIEKQTMRKAAAYPVLKNYGKTVAKMTAWKMELQICDSSERPDVSAYALSELNFAPSIVPPGEPIPQVAFLRSNGRFIREGDLNDILSLRTRTLWLCGITRYEDVFKSEPVHETKFCYFYEIRWKA